MGENTKIEWAHHTFNPWIGCTKVSPECANCYAESMSNFRGWAKWGKGQPRKRTSIANWKKPFQWNREAAQLGERKRVFCASLADVFDAEVPQEWRDDLWALIYGTPSLDWLLLTKRPENIPLMIPRDWRTKPMDNVWLGASVGHPDTKWRIGDLVNVPAVVHYLSCEPLLADLDKLELHDIEWVIAGGESGSHARPMHPEWLRSLRDQCKREGVKFLFKQWGEWVADRNPVVDRIPILSLMDAGKHGVFNEAGQWRINEGTFSNYDNLLGQLMYRVGKKNAGRLLDGRTWDEFPFSTK